MMAEPPNDNRLFGVKVMVVESSEAVRRSAESFLEQAGCVVATASDGFAALSEIVDHEPDIIFLDVATPRLDGYQVCALIKRNQLFRSTPVVLLSSKDGLFDRARARVVGSEQYLSKPFTAEELLGAVRQSLQGDHGAAGWSEHRSATSH